MKRCTLTRLLTSAAAGLAAVLALSSCGSVAPGYQAAGYSPRDAYHRGHVHGAGDRANGRAYDPHISEDRTLPRAHRSEYMGGYSDGFRNPGGYQRGWK